MRILVLTILEGDVTCWKATDYELQIVPYWLVITSNSNLKTDEYGTIFCAYSVVLKGAYTLQKFSTEWKIFRGLNEQYDVFFRKNRTAHAVREKFSVPWKVF